VTVQAGAANKELVRVQIHRIVDDQATPVEVLEERQLAGDRRGFSYAIGPLAKDTTLLFNLTDSDGIKSRDPVRLVLVAVPDQPPQVAVQLDGIGTAVTPQARIPVAGRITDDYGVAKVWFEWAVDQQKPGERVIADLKERPTDFPLAGVALEVRELGVKAGQKLSVSVRAADGCDLGQGPNVAGSERWVLDVVTPEQLRTMLESRELVLRQRFDAMIQEMSETRDVLAHLEFAPAKKSAAKAEKAAQGKEPGDEEAADGPDRQRTLRRLRVEGAVSNCRKGGPEVLGVAESFDDIRRQLINNRIDTEELKNRLQGGIADPLRQIAERMFPELEHGLEELLTVLDDPAQAPAARDRAQQQAEDIVLAMRKVRERMIELEDFNEAVQVLRELIKRQEQLRNETQQRHKDKVRELLEE
jgi:hypothetical protein